MTMPKMSFKTQTFFLHWLCNDLTPDRSTSIIHQVFDFLQGGPDSTVKLAPADELLGPVLAWVHSWTAESGGEVPSESWQIEGRMEASSMPIQMQGSSHRTTGAPGLLLFVTLY